MNVTCEDEGSIYRNLAGAGTYQIFNLWGLNIEPLQRHALTWPCIFNIFILNDTFFLLATSIFAPLPKITHVNHYLMVTGNMLLFL